MAKFFFLFFGALPVVSLASAPLGGCRVIQETLKRHSALANNAGCVLMRVAQNQAEFLLVHVNKGPNDKGWGFPGGKPANSENDEKELQGRALKMEYTEPSACTAARETREETGEEVIVGELLSMADRFHAYECFPLFPERWTGRFEPDDRVEVSQIAWISYESLKRDPSQLRFGDNLRIMAAQLEKKGLSTK